MDKTLEQLKEQYSQIAGDWNGEDKSFQSGGTVYTEDEALLATDIVDAIDHLENLLADFKF
jgi:hypothetical protein